MALSTKAKRRLKVAMAQAIEATEITNAIDAATTAATTLYVSPTGSDLNPGTGAAPYQTITAAVASLPTRINHNVLIELAAGAYLESVRLEGKQIAAGVTLTIQGSTWNTVIPATGVSTGVFTSFSGQFAILTGAGWTINNLRGKFIRVDSGASAGQYWPIISNTATDLEIVSAASATTLNGATFTIVEPAATWRGVLPTQAPFALGVFNTHSTGRDNGSSHAHYPALFVRNIAFIGGATGNTWGIYAEYSAVAVQQCSFVFLSSTAGQQYALRMLYSQAEVANCYGSTAVNTRFVVLYNSSAHFNGFGLVQTGGSNGHGVALFNSQLDLTFNNGVSFAGAWTRGLWMANNSTVEGKLIAKGCNNGVYIEGGSANFNWGVEISACGQGIVIDNPSGQLSPGGFAILSAISTGTAASGIRNCTSQAIAINSPCELRLRSGFECVGNTIGVGTANGAGGKAASFVSIGIGASVTFSGQTTNRDFTIDGGTTFKTLAEVIAAPNSTIANADQFTRVFKTTAY